MPKATSVERDERLNVAIDRAEETAYGSDEKGELSRDRARAIDMFWGRNTNPAPEGRSQVVDRSVFETIMWILPSIIDIFANGDDVIALPPVGPEDEEGAKQEAQYLNHVMLNKNPWLELVLTLAVDSMLTKNAYTYVYREYKREVEIEEYENQTQESLAVLTDDKEVEVLEQEEFPDPDYEPQPMVMETEFGPQPVIDIETGQPAMQPPPMLYNVKIRRVSQYGNYCIDVLPPEHCKISEKTPSYRMKDCSYFEYFCDETISNLRKRGFEVDDDINDEDSDDTEEDLARDQYNENNEADNESDPAMRTVKVRTIWIEHDYDEDGIAEMQRVVRVGRTILERKEVGRIHVASTVTVPVPHRHIGMSIADMVKDLQEIKTAILRGGLDNLYLSNNGRMAASNKVSIDDLLLSRPGQPIRIDTDGPDVAGHLMPVVAPFIFPQAMEGLEYMDQVKENRTGTNRYFTGIDQNAMNKTASGTNQLITMAAQRVKLICRIFGGCIEDIGSILHEVILKSGHKPEVVQLRGKWVTVDPAAWKKRKDFRAEVAYAAGNKDALIQKLLMIGNLQEKALAGGLPVVTPENAYNTGIELAKAMDFPSGDKFFTDPKKIPPPKPPQPDPSVVAMEQIKAQSAEKIKGAELSQKDRESAEDNALEKYKTDQDNQTKLIIAQMQHEHAMQLKDKEAEHGAGNEVLKAQLNPKTKEAEAKQAETRQKDTALQVLMEEIRESRANQAEQNKQVLEAVKALSGPRKVIRDKKTDKVVGTEPA